MGLASPITRANKVTLSNFPLCRSSGDGSTFFRLTRVFEKSHAVQSDTVLVGWETLC
jgi:hypothetical protein